MDFIQTSNKQVDKFGPGKHGFSAGNPAGGVPATYFSPDWADGVQQEHINVIEASGLVPSGASFAQVVQAIKRMFGGNVTTVNFAASPFALTADHAGLVIVDATAGNVVINLPAANVIGATLKYKFVRKDVAANTATVSRAGADLIDFGVTSFKLAANGGSREIVGNAVDGWHSGARRTVRNQRFTANGTFSVPAGVTIVYLSGSGGGGGGSGYDGTGNYGGGGGGGGDAKIKHPVSVTPLSDVTVTIAAGGAEGAASSNGSAGGTTSFGALLSLTGGGGGTIAASASSGGAAGGSGGGRGGGGSANNIAGEGGGSIFGATGSVGSSGVAAGGYGAGGAGGRTSGGNAGAPGFLLIEWDEA